MKVEEQAKSENRTFGPMVAIRHHSRTPYAPNSLGAQTECWKRNGCMVEVDILDVGSIALPIQLLSVFNTCASEDDSVDTSSMSAGAVEDSCAIDRSDVGDCNGVE